MSNRSNDHAAHDVLAVSAFVAGDAAPAERRFAEQLISTCADCARLAADLRSIADALPTSAVPPRPRDFRLTATDAARGRSRTPHGGWSVDRLIAAFRPAGAALATLGVAGLLLAGVTGLGGTTALPSSAGSGAFAPAAGGYDTGRNESAAPPSAAAASAAAFSGGGVSSPATSPAASGAGGEGAGAGTGSTPPRLASSGATTDVLQPIPPAPAPAPLGPSPLVVGSAAALAMGVILLLAWFAARGRTTPAP